MPPPSDRRRTSGSERAPSVEQFRPIEARPVGPLRFVHCPDCRLRTKPAFKDKSAEEIAVIHSLKIDQRRLPAGTEIIHIGQEDAELFTLYSGWAFRFKLLRDGRRQILNFLLPGDLVGLQASLLSASQHGIEALTEVELCVFPRNRAFEFFARAPVLAYEMAWLGSREQAIVDENLTSVGRRSAAERIAALVLSLHRRAEALDLLEPRGFLFPLTQQHIADALGLSLVHTNKTWSRLRRDGLFEINDGYLMLKNPRLTRRLAALYDQDREKRPLI